MSKARDIADLNVTILDSVESGATADQTNAEIRAAVEAASDSNVFTDADHTLAANALAKSGGTMTGALVLNNTGSVKVAAGTTGQRESSPAAGMFRFNTSTSAFEGYSNAWGEIGGGGGNIVDFVASGTLPNGKPVVLKADGTVEVVASAGAGNVISAGSPTIFDSSQTTWISVTMLTSSKALVVYRDDGNSAYGTACVLTISGTSITAGTAVVFESASMYYPSVTMLTDTKALVVYQDRGNSSYGTANVINVSGTSITVGTPVVFNSASSEYVSSTMLNSTKVLVVYRNVGNAGKGTSRILTVQAGSGTNISVSAAVLFENASVYYPKVTALSATKAIVAYYDAGNSQVFTACVLDVSGTSITAGTPANVTSTAGIGRLSITTLTTTKALVVYQDNGNSGYGSSNVITVSGSSISAGSTTVFESASSDAMSVTTLTSTKALVTYRDQPNSNYGTSCILDVSGTSITAGTPVVFEAANVPYTSVTMLTATKTIVTYQDAVNSAYGTSCVLDNVIDTNLSTTNFVGMSSGAYTNGQTATVDVLGGISSNQTSLTIGATYYIQVDGTLSTTADTPSVIAGKAVSATKLILKGV